jgi:hypothetical protein
MSVQRESAKSSHLSWSIRAKERRREVFLEKSVSSRAKLAHEIRQAALQSADDVGFLMGHVMIF